MWQVCDITQPLLRKLIDNAALRQDYEPKNDGYYCNGAWAKIQAIMKTMIVAIRAQLPIESLDFQKALKFPDVVEGNTKESRRITRLVPVPEVRISEEKKRDLVNQGIDITFLRLTGAVKRGMKQRSVRLNELTKKLQSSRNLTLGGKTSQEVKDQETSSQKANEESDQHSVNHSPGQQVSRQSDEFMTAEDNFGHTPDRMDDNSEDEFYVGIEEREFDDEDRESEDEYDEGDEDERRDGDDEEDAYDSETTDAVDPTTFEPQSL